MNPGMGIGWKCEPTWFAPAKSMGPRSPASRRLEIAVWRHGVAGFAGGRKRIFALRMNTGAWTGDRESRRVVCSDKGTANTFRYFETLGAHCLCCRTMGKQKTKSFHLTFKNQVMLPDLSFSFEVFLSQGFGKFFDGVSQHGSGHFPITRPQESLFHGLIPLADLP